MCHLNHSFLVNSLKWTITKEESIHTDRYNTNVSIACVGLIVPNPPPKKKQQQQQRQRRQRTAKKRRAKDRRLYNLYLFRNESIYKMMRYNWNWS